MQSSVFFPLQLHSSRRIPRFQTCPKSPLYIPNDLQIDLQESNLHSKEREPDIAGFLSVLTVEDVSSGPPGAAALRQIRASWERYVIIPQS